MTADNLDEVLALDIHEHQRSFVSSTACSLAQAYVNYKTAFPFAVYADDTVVGFIMMGYYTERKQYTLWKLLTDKAHQNKGYGRQALRLGIEFITNNFGAKEIYTGVVTENETAKHLYRSEGFTATGVVEGRMEEMKYVCR